MTTGSGPAASIGSHHVEHRGWWFIFSRNKMLLEEREGSTTVPLLYSPSELKLQWTGERYLGSLRGIDCYCARLQDGVERPAGTSLVGLRRLFGALDDDLFGMATLGLHLVQWDRAQVFCSRCGASLTDREDVRAKECQRCGAIVFPRISPAVIVLIKREDEILLARSERFEQGLYSVLAGFVEPGETLEDAVVREVREEVGLSVSNITYFGSQPWPYPDSLMIGFIADYESGEISIDGTEIVDAGWYRAGSLPAIPDKVSIARRLIDWFVQRHADASG